MSSSHMLSGNFSMIQESKEILWTSGTQQKQEQHKDKNSV